MIEIPNVYSILAIYAGSTLKIALDGSKSHDLVTNHTFTGDLLADIYADVYDWLYLCIFLLLNSIPLYLNHVCNVFLDVGDEGQKLKRLSPMKLFFKL